MNIVPYTEDQRKYLNLFCKKCKKEGIINNSSYENIKIEELEGYKGTFWLCYDNEMIVSGAGAQLINIYGRSVIRALYRAASLTSYRSYFSSLSKYHFNSIPFSMILPYCIEWRNFNHPNLDIVITTNVDFKKSKTSNTNRLFFSLEKYGLVSHIGEVFLYNVRQNCWKLCEELYLNKLKDFYKKNNVSVLLDKLYLYNEYSLKRRFDMTSYYLKKKGG